MGRYFTIERIETGIPGETLLKLGFGEAAGNDLITPAAIEEFRSLRLAGGKLVKFDGPASLPVAMALAHEVAHLFGAVAVKDPKLGQFVVAVSHDPRYRVGDLID